jgi:hypothetical protein
MAGKAVAVAKAVVKKPVAAKAVAKKPVAAKAVVKKPVAAKAAKKPAVAKFNLNKLMMLIVRDAPKKGKKMMGGYKKAPLQAGIFTPITTFITTYRPRINNRITEILSNESSLKTTVGVAVAAPIPVVVTTTVTEKSIEQFIMNIAEQEFLYKTLDDFTLPSPVTDANRYNFDKRTYDCNFMTIVIALCKVYKLFDDNKEP